MRLNRPAPSIQTPRPALAGRTGHAGLPDPAGPAAGPGRGRRAAWLAALLLGAAAAVPAATPAGLLDGYAAAAGAPPQPARGQALFTGKHGREWSCSSCHGALPTGEGRHAATGKAITPLAPAFNGQRLSDAAKVEKWLKRNCGDVLGRDCSAAEKADVLAWLISLRP